MRAKPKQKNIKFNSICFEITQTEYFVKKTKRRHESICLGFIFKDQPTKLWQLLLKIAEEVHYSRTLKLCAPGFCRFLMKKMPGMWHFLTRQWSLWELKLRFCNSLKRKQKKCVDLWHSKKFVDGYSHRAFSLNLLHTCFTQPHNPDDPDAHMNTWNGRMKQLYVFPVFLYNPLFWIIIWFLFGN